jgi:sulfate transport system substrate-binding protein
MMSERVAVSGKSKAEPINAAALLLIVVAAALLLFKNYRGHRELELLNVSYDPTREVYAQIDAKFSARFARETGHSVGIEQSHGGSSSQARAVAAGLAADVVTLALPSDIENLHRSGLVGDNWSTRFPHDSQPYSSTIVFVVRKSNPKHIRDWPDLTTAGIDVVTPDPQTSGNGKLTFLAAWGSVIRHGGTAAQARDLVTKLYRNVAVLGAGARDSTTTFEFGNEGDVHVTWENEAIREVAESKGALQIVYPPTSIRAEPSVAVVDAVAAKHHSEAAAQAYLNYLFSDEAQEIFADNGYRPNDAAMLRKHRDRLPPIDLFGVTLIAKNWDDAQEKFFGDNGLFNAIRLANANLARSN